MIHSVTFENFYSFKDEIKIDLTINDQVSQKDWYFTSKSGQRLNKLLIVVGPNASGKTNLLRSISFIKWLIVDSSSWPINTELPFKPFLFGELQNKSTKLSVRFEIENKVFIYSFSLNREKIIDEELRVKSKTKERTTEKVLFSRTWNEKTQTYKFNGENFSFSKGFEYNLKKTASVVSTAANHKESLEIVNFWRKFQSNVIEIGTMEEYFKDKVFLDSLNFFNLNKDLKEKAEELLSRFDIGLDQFEIIRKEINPQLVNFEVNGTHAFNNKKYVLPFFYESSGTRRLFTVLSSILQVLNTGGIAVIDELDASLHPDMISPLIDLFAFKHTNPFNAQIIFSTHSHRLLTELDKYQIILVEKNKAGSSEAWRLDDMKGIRADDNFYYKYIAGAYGAIPDIS